ncbi:MAG TPA: protein translocase subunit SecD [Leptospiraceae bacterium]|nr:protein translocase subunit SecD [Leptospiraceae bacterium]HMX33361.1 protein translocase subunit SecD [Leptospiraceae bacterium]HMY31385.1 protein translocase subunit SecD [Leptospiraceae bacterium]HMZ64995.1 protein translocase subunit SecD [Leptospiraceae bacterium]HNA09601.1 protein translocase subunit SecD [Leptospiraceae bacterium]
MKSSSWVLLPITILVLSLVILFPNFAVRELELHISPSVASMTDQEKQELLNRFQERWKAEYNTQNALKIEPDPALGIPAQNYFLVTGRFITSAKINQISQENINLFLESKNNLRPTPIEKFFKNGKSMTIKLGLDLQGGMRVVMKGDFENYVSKLRDIYSKEISDLKATIAANDKSKEEKDKATARLKDIEDSFILTESRKIIELEKAKLIIDNRLTNQNLTEPQVRIQKDQDSIEVSLPGVANSSQILEILQNTETVEYRLEEPDGPNSYSQLIEKAEQELMSQNKREETEIVQFQKVVASRPGKKVKDEFLFMLEEKYKIPRDKYKLYAYYARGNKPNSPLLPRRFIVLEKAIALSGNDLTDARPSFNSNNYGWTVSFSLTPAGTDKFLEVTKNNKGRNLAIIWGDQVISNPRINEPIAGGHAEISGSFNQEDAIQLSNIISEGALPIPLSVLEMRFIGPTLGIESIEVGLKSVMYGFILVILYMIFYYKLAGIVANISLIANLIILMGLLSLMDFTLTLPGFAGIILTVGMAVDANVIIYERIKEELIAGKSLPIAVTQGFENAFWTIFDSNITTLISGILMIRLGNGPIKGFAITLCWGIITSMFTSLLLSRILLNLLVNDIGIRKLKLGFRNYEVKNV